MKTTALAFALALIASVVACSSDDSTPSSGTSSGGTQGTVSSCDLTADVGYCEDFGPEAPKDEAKNNCEGAKNTLGYNGVVKETASCPTENVVGSCEYVTKSGVKTTYRYYAPKLDAGTAETNCKTLGGTFTAK